MALINEMLCLDLSELNANVVTQQIIELCTDSIMLVAYFTKDVANSIFTMKLITNFYVSNLALNLHITHCY